MPLALRYAVRSDKGLVRGNNEDSVYAGPRLLAIADGMGGHAGGEVASKIVITTVEDLDEDRPIEDLITRLRERVQDANDNLSQQVRLNPKLEGMGTTLTALRFVGGRVGLVHVGDSRAYLYAAVSCPRSPTTTRTSSPSSTWAASPWRKRPSIRASR